MYASTTNTLCTERCSGKPLNIWFTFENITNLFEYYIV